MFGQGAGQLLRFGGNLIMTRLLVPEMFGVMAIANVILLGLALFSDLGLRQSIIQSKRGDDEDYLNTAWSLQILRGLILWSMALTAALVVSTLDHFHLFPAASAYADPRLPWIISVLSLSAVIAGFASTKSAMASRDLSLGRLTFIEMSSQVVSLVAMLVGGLIFRSIWVLVAAALVSEVMKTTLSHWAIPGRGNKWHWDKQLVKELFGFGKWIFLTSIIGFLSNNGDRFLMGGFLTAGLFGLYSQAAMSLGPIQDTIIKLIISIGFPAFCEAYRDNPEKLKSVYYKFRQPIDILSLFLAGLLFSSGHLLINLLYDGRYAAAGPLLEILSISLLEVRYNASSQVYLAIGKPQLLSPLILVRMVALYALMPLAYLVGGTSLAVWMVGGAVLCTIPLNLYFMAKNGILDVKKELIYLPFVGLGLLLGYGLVLLISGHL